MSRTAGRLLAVLGVALSLTPTLAGCGGGSVAPLPAGPAVSNLRVGLMEYRFQLSAAAVRPGTVTVTATNVGSDRHDVEFFQKGHKIGGSHLLEPGAEQTFTIHVAPGTGVHLECTVPGHDEAGMHADLRVVGH